MDSRIKNELELQPRKNQIEELEKLNLKTPTEMSKGVHFRRSRSR